MTTWVVDTNVAVVANGDRSPQADAACRRACLAALARVRDGVVVVDAGGKILREYLRHLSPSGQPGAGDFFMKWLWNVQADASRCERVKLTPKPDSPDDFEEFPDDPNLRGFDPSDRKFVAVALASRNRPTVLNAVDSDWADFHAALRRHGVNVRFLCPQHVCPAPLA